MVSDFRLSPERRRERILRHGMFHVKHSLAGEDHYDRAYRFRFPDPGRDLSGKFRNALGPLFGDWVFSHFETAIAA